ncbi:conserved hypothetical protein [Neospora caninum Liverpool]|uniref:Golgi to ER traffic protein 4 n=1 Tax=Neospora caninum (strain Liverpool) TaxID=572307 RepID=F0VPR7_NEOCL|nr:conserved hypothetical protein [Neospora caninum Liverpool]CBZ55714.1 conserved hypothetical protein [Neospora caninum Liverpool]CEL70457.1 TPA: Golgi to ER traffic protein 4 [Neospora caninum Liverpool]|eukprot:XP_003885740.1 conserved hypothetical protein [Neospora caninum Liverpool]
MKESEPRGLAGPTTLREAAGSVLPLRVRASVDRKIDSGDLYDAHQLVRTLFFRFMAKRESTQAVELCRVYGLRFAGLDQEALAVDLGMNMLTALEASRQAEDGAPPSDEQLGQVIELFNACAAAGGKKGVDKYKLINRALKWSRSPQSPFGHVRLHRAAAEAYWKEQRYGLCQGHLIYCRDPEALSQMVKEWQAAGYLSERPFFWLRLILILLCLRDTETAEKVLGGSGENWDSSEVPAPLQLAYLLVCACKYKSGKLFDLLKQKYHLVLRRDETFAKYMDEIEKRTIGRIQRPSVGLASLFSSLMASLSADDES